MCHDFQGDWLQYVREYLSSYDLEYRCSLLLKDPKQ